MRTRALALVGLLTTVLVHAEAPADRECLAKIRAEGRERSQVQPVFDELTVAIGPRLTASPAHKRAVEFVRERLASYGLSNVRMEPWKFGRGWTLEKIAVEMIEPRYLPLIGYADGWSPSTKGEIVAAPIFVGGKSPEAIAAMAAELKGAIVMTQPVLTSFVRKDRPQPSDPSYVPMSAAYATSVGNQGRSEQGRGANAGNQDGRGAGPSPAQRMAQAVRDAGAGVILKPSVGEHGTVFVTGRDGGPGAVPAVTIAAEQYNMIAGMLERKIPVKLRVNVQSTFHDADGGNAYNVLAELQGSAPEVRDEIEMIGAQ